MLKTAADFEGFATRATPLTKRFNADVGVVDDDLGADFGAGAPLE